MGQAEQGLSQVARGIDLYQGLKTPPVFWPLLLYVRAWAYGQGGKPEQGLAYMDQAMEIVSGGPRTAMASEFIRFRGDLLLAVSLDNAAQAESWLQQALQIARENQALMPELRAALSLSRLWQQKTLPTDQDKAGQSRQLLGDIYARFTEGFETADLKEANILIIMYT
jgi:hypothetical protein